MAKTIADPIHGRITLSALSMQVVDTREFQRLRDIKQLGMCNRVFPGATHTRFEHSLGVAYLARRLVVSMLEKSDAKELRPRAQSERKTCVEDGNCSVGVDPLPANVADLVELAGLCHDLGHGPFGHLYDELVQRLLKYSAASADPALARHERRSCVLLRHIAAKYELPISEADLALVCDLIDPPAPAQRVSPHGFLYSIVANSETGIDVDKLDYIKRDSRYTQYPTDVQIERLLETIRVVGGKVCFPKKVAFELYDLFLTRYRLHHEIYKHRVVHTIHLMIKECLREAEPELGILNAALELDLERPATVERFAGLTDTVLALIRAAPALYFPKRLLDAIDQRELYRLVADAPVVIWLRPDHDSFFVSGGRAAAAAYNLGFREGPGGRLRAQWVAPLDRLEEFVRELDERGITYAYIPGCVDRRVDYVVQHLDLGYKTDPVASVWFYDPRANEDAQPFHLKRADVNFPASVTDDRLRVFLRPDW